jgi:putative sterol carrier protein
MAVSFPSAEWAAAYHAAINQNPLYKKAAATWDQGAIAFVCSPEPSLGLETAHAVVLDLLHGECRGAHYTTDPTQYNAAPFVIEASYAQWTSVLQGKLDPIKAMLGGQLKLTQGHLPTIIRDVEGSKQLVLSASTIDTTFRS